MKKQKGILYWLPRILCIMAILFLSVFAFDSFSPNLSIWQQIRAFLLHLTPSFVLFAFLAVAWKWELIGGLIFTTIGIVASPFIYFHNYRMNHSVGSSILVILIVSIPFVIIGILFIIGHIKNRNLMHSDNS